MVNWQGTRACGKHPSRFQRWGQKLRTLFQEENQSAEQEARVTAAIDNFLNQPAFEQNAREILDSSKDRIAGKMRTIEKTLGTLPQDYEMAIRCALVKSMEEVVEGYFWHLHFPPEFHEALRRARARPGPGPNRP